MLTDKELIEKLHCDCSKEEQQQAIGEIIARETFDTTLLMKNASKVFGEIDAFILSKMSYERLLPVVDDLFGWIWDLNTPGAEEILELLTGFPIEVFMPHYEDAVRQAIFYNDSSYLGYLSYYLCSKVKKDDFADPGLYDLLEERRKVYWP